MRGKTANNKVLNGTSPGLEAQVQYEDYMRNRNGRVIYVDACCREEVMDIRNITRQNGMNATGMGHWYCTKNICR